jgi:hypothetical protein
VTIFFISVAARQEDDEMVLQIIYVFYVISRHTATRDYLIKETGILYLLVTPLYPRKLALNFADKWRSLSRYSSLAD